MQIRDKRFYTYPVIGSQFNSYATSSFSNDVTESVSGSDLYLLFEAKTDNQEINDLLDVLNNDWDGDHYDCDAYGFNTKMFDENVYYLQFQTI